jgi:hypothetical protein
VAKAARLAPEQLRALDRLRKLPEFAPFYLAGASAIAWHLHHRQSLDLDLFSKSPRASLAKVEAAIGKMRDVTVLSTTDVMVGLDIRGVPVDVVKYPYPLLEEPVPGPHGFPVAGRRDLAAMKLAAISRRGIKRDFWDLYALAEAGTSFGDAGRAYVQRFGRTRADLYAVQRAMTWFQDAESDPVPVRGLTPALWRRIKAYFLKNTPGVLDEL